MILGILCCYFKSRDQAQKNITSINGSNPDSFSSLVQTNFNIVLWEKEKHLLTNEHAFEGDMQNPGRLSIS